MEEIEEKGGELGYYFEDILTCEMQESLEILGEAYGSNIKEKTIYIYDIGYCVNGWRDEYLKEAVRQGIPRIYFLTHPREWGSCWWANIYANAQRIYEGICY